MRRSTVFAAVALAALLPACIQINFDLAQSVGGVFRPAGGEGVTVHTTGAVGVGPSEGLGIAGRLEVRPGAEVSTTERSRLGADHRLAIAIGLGYLPRTTLSRWGYEGLLDVSVPISRSFSSSVELAGRFGVTFDGGTRTIAGRNRIYQWLTRTFAFLLFVRGGARFELDAVHGACGTATSCIGGFIELGMGVRARVGTDLL